MKLLLSLSLWLALLMPSCGNAGRHEEESTTEYYDYSTETATPDYDYSATFDYFYDDNLTGVYSTEVPNKAAGIGPLSPLLLLGLAVHQIWN